MATISARTTDLDRTSDFSRDIEREVDLVLMSAGGFADHSRVDLLTTDHGSARMLRRRTSNRDRLFPTSPRDRGVTFVELLVSIVLLGLVGVAVLVATAAALTGARTSDEIAKSQAAIAEVADFMTDTEPENVTYLDCASVAPADIEAAYQQDVDDFFGPGVVEVEDVAFWNGSDFAGCTFGAGERLQQVTLRTVVNESPRSVVVVKRPVDVPTVGVGTPETIPPYTGGSGQASVTLTDWMVTWP